MPEVARLPRWLELANPLIVALQRRGVVIGTMRLLSVPGRKSGRLRTTPVSPLTVRGERYIIAGLEGADWVKNARVAGWGILARGRDRERVNLVELPLQERPPSCENSRARYPKGSGFFGNSTASPALQKSSKHWRLAVLCSGWRRPSRDLIREDPRWVLQHLVPGVGIPE
jgi:hypothetical protein